MYAQDKEGMGKLLGLWGCVGGEKEGSQQELTTVHVGKRMRGIRNRRGLGCRVHRRREGSHEIFYVGDTDGFSTELVFPLHFVITWLICNNYFVKM